MPLRFITTSFRGANGTTNDIPLTRLQSTVITMIYDFEYIT